MDTRKMSDDHDEHIAKSIFNSAMQYCTEELAGIRKRLHEARVIHNWDLTYDLLVSFYLALSAKMTGKMLKEHEDMFKAVTQTYVDYTDYKNKKKPKPNMIIFLEWERRLRKHENKLGLLTPDNQDPALALGMGMR